MRSLKLPPGKSEIAASSLALAFKFQRFKILLSRSPGIVPTLQELPVVLNLLDLCSTRNRISGLTI